MTLYTGPEMLLCCCPAGAIPHSPEKEVQGEETVAGSLLEKLNSSYVLKICILITGGVLHVEADSLD